MHTIERQVQQNNINNIQEWATRNGFNFQNQKLYVCIFVS